MTSIDGGIQFAQVPLDNEILKASPVPDDAEQVLFAAPAAPNCRVEIYSVSVSFAVAPVDGTNVITGDLVVYDASANSGETIADDVDFEGVDTAYEARTIWQGSKSLDPGDTLTLKFTTTTPDTAAEGGLVTIAYRVREWGGQ